MTGALASHAAVGDPYPPYRWQGLRPERPPCADLAALATEIVADRIKGERRRGLQLTDIALAWENPQGARALVRVVYTSPPDGEPEDVLAVVTAGEDARAVIAACRAVVEAQRRERAAA